MLGAAGQAFQELFTPPFRVVLWKCVGFTVALFFATASIGPGPTLSAIKMGALVSTAGVFAALIAARLLHTGRFAHRIRR